MDLCHVLIERLLLLLLLLLLAVVVHSFRCGLRSLLRLTISGLDESSLGYEAKGTMNAAKIADVGEGHGHVNGMRYQWTVAGNELDKVHVTQDSHSAGALRHL